MWNSASRVTKNGTQYELDDLEPLIDVIGVTLDGADTPLEAFPKDGLCEIHYSEYLNGITNGEYIYGVYEVLKDLLGDYPCVEAPLYKEAILCSLTDQMAELFRDKVKLKDAEDSDKKQIWRLYATSRRNLKRPLWIGEDDQAIQPPRLDALADDDWELILEAIYDEFFWDRDWDLFKNFALSDPQPHFPTFQEYRKAITWIRHIFSETPTNRSIKAQKFRARSGSNIKTLTGCKPSNVFKRPPG